MNNLVIYAQPFKDESGKVIQLRLKVCADNRFSYYKPYTFFASHLSIECKSRFWPGFNQSTCNEHLARARRVIAFADMSKLQPVRFTRKHFGDLLDKAHKGMRCDHVTCWKSYWGTRFILNEPYNINANFVSSLAGQGLIAIELPIDFSPYCGVWNEQPATKPWTRSFLICDSIDKNELLAISEVLASGTNIDWNSLKGIGNV